MTEIFRFTKLSQLPTMQQLSQQLIFPTLKYAFTNIDEIGTWITFPFLSELFWKVPLAICAQSYKKFYVRNLRVFIMSQSACLWQSFLAQSNVCGAYPRMKYLSNATLQGRLLALPTCIRQGWRVFQRTDSLAYYKHS